jgi:hypothetical protein
MRSTWFAVAVLGFAATATSPFMGCSASGSAGAPSTGGTNAGGSQPAGSGGTGLGGSGSGGLASLGGATGRGGSGGSTSSGAGGNSGSGGQVGGEPGSSPKGGSGGSANTGGTTGRGGGGGSGGTDGGMGGTVGSGGTTGAGGTAGSGGTIGAGGIAGSGGATATGGTAGSSGTGPAGPCDIYQSAGTPCGAAHSTVRALYASYSGPLYQVQRASDKTTKDILVGSGGFADSSVQDSFCSGTTCTIPIIYDQSPNGNHLRVTWFAYWLQSGGNPATATAAKITVGGHSVYGIKSGTNVAYRTGVPLSGTAAITKGSATVTFSSPQTLPAGSFLLFATNAKDCPANSWPNGCNFHTYFTSAAISAATTVTLTAAYSGTSNSATVVWNATTKGIATGDAAEGEYSVFDGKTSGQWCCFDYGNSEIDGIDEGNATMEAIYWGSDTQFGQSGGGSGPWVGADLENGLYYGYENGSAKVPSNTSVTGFPYVTAMLKGLSAKDCPAGLTSSGCFALKAGNATSGKMAYKWNATTSTYGARPSGYSPQKKQGAIILGTGGDGSNSGVGIWFEGAMTMGAPADSTDDAVQANIVAAGYGK